MEERGATAVAGRGLLYLVARTVFRRRKAQRHRDGVEKIRDFIFRSFGLQHAQRGEQCSDLFNVARRRQLKTERFIAPALLYRSEYTETCSDGFLSSFLCFSLMPKGTPGVTQFSSSRRTKEGDSARPTCVISVFQSIAPHLLLVRPYSLVVPWATFPRCLVPRCRSRVRGERSSAFQRSYYWGAYNEGIRAHVIVSWDPWEIWT